MLKNLVSAVCLVTIAGCSSSSDSQNNGAEEQPDSTIELSENEDTDSTTDSGNDGSDEQMEAAVLVGVFLDSAVEGLTYETSTQSGTTNALGEFDYLEGELVTFSIGETVFPAVIGSPERTPIDMASGSSNPEDTTTNIARLLQSLDVDGNPDNGITIPDSASANAAAINFDVSVDQFENDAAVINLVANSGSENTSLISEDEANQHLNETLGFDSGDNTIATAPTYQNQIRDGEGESSITDNVINLTSFSSDGSRQRNRLIVDTESRLIWDLTVTEADPGDMGIVNVRSLMVMYNDTTDSLLNEPEDSFGNIMVDVSLTLFAGETEMTMDICTSRDVIDDTNGISIFDEFNGENCLVVGAPVPIGERITLGSAFDLESGVLSVFRNDTVLTFRVPEGPTFQPIFPFNILEVRAQEGESRIVTELRGIGSDGFDDDFSNGVIVEGINN